MSARQTLDALERSVTHAATLVISCFPRGSTQIVQPAKVSHTLLKAYSKELYKDDRPTWQAIKQNKVLADADIWEGAGGNAGFEAARYYREFMNVSDLRHVAVAPLTAPIFTGYAGALHVYRTYEQGPFSGGELSQIGRLARQFDQAAETGRQSRQGRITAAMGWVRRPPVQQFVFDAHLKPLLPGPGLEVLDDRVREQMLRHAKQVLGRIEADGYSNNRICLPDSRGDLWVFRAVAYSRYPGLTDGHVIFYCLQPDCREWSALRAADLVADPEIARLAPAMQFMHKEFGRGPTLNDIAATVDLSPFHFHRRFTELYGITPKHFLLECQIYAAKCHMFSGDKNLVEIANSCGFAHQSHYTSRFKQATGLTPTGWRRLAGELRMAR